MLFILSTGFNPCFLAGLRSYLLRGEAGNGGITTLAFSAGAVWAGLSIPAPAPQITVALPSQAEHQATWGGMLADLEGVLSNTADLPLGVMFAAVAVVSLRTKVFPTWLGWLAVLAALAMFTLTFTVVAASGPLAPQGWATYVLLLPPTLWFVPAPIIMHRRAGAAGAAASNDPSAPARTGTGAHTSRSRGRRADNPSKGERAWSGNECWPSPAWALHRLSPSTC